MPASKTDVLFAAFDRLESGCHKLFINTSRYETVIMDDSDDEEEVRKAIALSLQDQNNVQSTSVPTGKDGPTREVIDLDSDSDTQLTPLAQKGPFTSDTSTAQSTMAPTVTNPNFLGLNRKAMEQERLARKRHASISPPATHKTMRRSISPSQKITATSKDTFRSDQPLRIESSHLQTAPFNSTTPVVSKSEPTFLEGAVRKTWAFGHERKEDIKIEEVLQPADLKLAVLSSFQWDITWLLSKLNRKTKMIFVMQAKDLLTMEQYERETSEMENLRLCFPPMDGQTKCMHSKLMLLSFPTHLRIVVPTANLVPYDWGETGHMENMLFLIDLPRLPQPVISKDSLTSFCGELIYFLMAMKLPKSVIQSVLNFDFSKTKDLAFVHSIGGAHSGEDGTWRRTGYGGLGKAIKELGLQTDEPLSLDIVTSSLGNLNLEYLIGLYLAAQGDDGRTVYGWRNRPARMASWTVDDVRLRKKIEEQVNERLRIYFPTENTVTSSTGGTSSGGTICLHSKYYKCRVFPRGLLRDCQSRRGGLLMHSKVCQRPRWQTARFLADE